MRQCWTMLWNRCQNVRTEWVDVQAVLVRISARLLKKTLLRTDERAKLEGELLDGIDVVKCMTWEVTPLNLSPECSTLILSNTTGHQTSQLVLVLAALPVHECMCCCLPLLG